jgi:pilus assembly protein CpaC
MTAGGKPSRWWLIPVAKLPLITSSSESAYRTQMCSARIPLEGGNRLQISAVALGVTQVDLLGADDSVHTIEVMVLGDVRELEAILRQQFPDANLQVVPVQQGCIVSGFVTSDEHVNHVVSIAELYFPTVINKVNVTGIHTIQLETQIMEVSRTKLRELGVDWAFGNGDDHISQSVGGLLTTTAGGVVSATGTDTFKLGVIQGGSSFFTSIRALRRNNLVKVLASPTLTAVDGRPASFNAVVKYRLSSSWPRSSGDPIP